MAATRGFTVSSIGGKECQLTVPADARVSELYKQCHEQGLGCPLSLLQGERILEDEEAPLPEESSLTAIVESMHGVPDAAQKVLRATPCPETSKADERFGLGPCGELGSFATQLWADPRLPEFMVCIGKYYVLALTIVDGAGPHRLVAVINEGNADCNTGIWGSVYLRPSFKEVAGVRSTGDTESTWEILDDSWYTPPKGEFPALRSELTGGTNAQKPLERQLAAAAGLVMFNRIKVCRTNDSDEED